jgi:hypothetical protein
MAAKRILLADGAGLSAHYWRSGRIKFETEFSNEPAGLEAFATYLKKHRGSLFFLLADIAEEGFQLEDLPYVQGGDRNALLKRRLGQYFYGTPLSLAVSLGRAKDGRRDERILFAALTRAEAFTPWLDALREAEAILAGVYSVPLVLAQFGPQILDAKGPALLLTLTRGGVRQTFFDQGKLHFSRLSQLATRGVDEIGRVCASDSAKIFQYLVAQRQIPRGSALRTVILAEPSQTQTLRDYCQSSPEIQFEFADLGAAARKLRLKDSLPDSNADRVFMHCVASKPPAQQFAPPEETRFHRLWKMRSAITGTAWVIFVACLLFAGKTGLKVAELRNQAETTRLATADDTRRYNAILEGLPKVDITPDNLRALISRHEALQQRLPRMEPLLAPPQPGIEREPQNRTGTAELAHGRQPGRHEQRGTRRPSQLHHRERRGLDCRRHRCPAPPGPGQRPTRPTRAGGEFRRQAARRANRCPRPESSLRHRIRQAAAQRGRRPGAGRGSTQVFLAAGATTVRSR